MILRAILVLYGLFLIMLLNACSDPCGYNLPYKNSSATFNLTLDYRDTMNRVASIHYPQVNKTENVQYTNHLLKYLYGFDETTIVINYKHDTINADTLTVKSVPRNVVYSECVEDGFYLEFGQVEVLYHTFSSIQPASNGVKVTK